MNHPWTELPRLRLACLDMAGTTVSDGGLVERSASVALAAQGVEPGTSGHAAGLTVVRRTMGMSKIVVFREIFDGDEAAAQRANAAFEQAYADLVGAGEVSALPGAAEAIAALREAGVAVVLTTGFARPTQDAIIDALGWRDLVDLALVPGDGLRGRPYPDLVLHAALRLGVDDVRAIVVAGDSVNDIGCGVRAGAGVVAGVLGGAHGRADLAAAGATHLLAAVAELPALLGQP
ncbi:phosphonatase-like hydrolase [Catellatospora citrea]|uniref:Putative haloacid dehalogenase-like hydrolase n=1 Tax=Catellatospora citrea TaxID=53366 RepID=A0A8J3K6H4_9ACTN|nr:phosphonatase-like hydrolase [Catellatospora citrea]RKE05903.1 phosphonatase-like hydrolase [Catellatospora citrea]GIF97566.1 putative haloacid dehalogenase-like hydrolase [Catellatospora citrea]